MELQQRSLMERGQTALLGRCELGGELEVFELDQSRSDLAELFFERGGLGRAHLRYPHANGAQRVVEQSTSIVRIGHPVGGEKIE